MPYKIITKTDLGDFKEHITFLFTRGDKWGQVLAKIYLYEYIIQYAIIVLGAKSLSMSYCVSKFNENARRFIDTLKRLRDLYVHEPWCYNEIHELEIKLTKEYSIYSEVGDMIEELFDSEFRLWMNNYFYTREL